MSDVHINSPLADRLIKEWKCFCGSMMEEGVWSIGNSRVYTCPINGDELIEVVGYLRLREPCLGELSKSETIYNSPTTS